MALIVETGAGVVGAESYLSAADALALLAKWSTDTTFAAATTGQQEVALRQAALFMDAAYESLLGGERVLASQSRAWPRYGARTRDGWLLDPSVVPDGWKLAQALLAPRALAGALAPDVKQDGALVEKETKVGSITTRKKWSDQSGTSQQPGFPEVGNALANLLVGSSVQGRRVLA